MFLVCARLFYLRDSPTPFDCLTPAESFLHRAFFCSSHLALPNRIPLNETPNRRRSVKASDASCFSRLERPSEKVEKHRPHTIRMKTTSFNPLPFRFENFAWSPSAFFLGPRTLRLMRVCFQAVSGLPVDHFCRAQSADGGLLSLIPTHIRLELKSRRRGIVPACFSWSPSK